VSARSATTWVDIRTPPAEGEPLGLITGYSGAVIEVSDLARAGEFYGKLIGLGSAAETTEGVRINLNPHQSLTLVQRSAPRTRSDTGVHQALSFPSSQVDSIVARLEAAGVEIRRYHEDRKEEHQHNRYCSDPDGNQVQLVTGREVGLDHVAVEDHDLEWAEVFYTQVLGAKVEMRIGWTMDDYARAWDWGRGDDQCAPGTRRWDTLYTDDKARVPRSNSQLFVQLAPGVSFGLYLATEHHQEPPRGLFDGTPRAQFWVAPGKLAELERRLREIRLRCMEPADGFDGPYVRNDDALFVRDTGGNFLEFREAPVR